MSTMRIFQKNNDNLEGLIRKTNMEKKLQKRLINGLCNWPFFKELQLKPEKSTPCQPDHVLARAPQLVNKIFGEPGEKTMAKSLNWIVERLHNWMNLNLPVFLILDLQSLPNFAEHLPCSFGGPLTELGDAIVLHLGIITIAPCKI